MLTMLVAVHSTLLCCNADYVYYVAIKTILLNAMFTMLVALHTSYVML